MEEREVKPVIIQPQRESIKSRKIKELNDYLLTPSIILLEALEKDKDIDTLLVTSAFDNILSEYIDMHIPEYNFFENINVESISGLDRAFLEELEEQQVYSLRLLETTLIIACIVSEDCLKIAKETTQRNPEKFSKVFLETVSNYSSVINDS
jgi:hypothetical protein